MTPLTLHVRLYCETSRVRLEDTGLDLKDDPRWVTCLLLRSAPQVLSDLLGRFDHMNRIAVGLVAWPNLQSAWLNTLSGAGSGTGPGCCSGTGERTGVVVELGPGTGAGVLYSTMAFSASLLGSSRLTGSGILRRCLLFLVVSLLLPSTMTMY